jgi:endonuclease/exonuclease/phosphatase family metal-dependent hydrolase
LILALVAGCSDSPDTGYSGPRLLVTPLLGACGANSSPPARIRIVTWNIEAGRGSSIGEIAGVLAAIDADVMLLQEVDVGTLRSGRIDQARTLADALRAAYAFAETIPWDGGHYGLAVLSRLPFQSVSRIALDAPDASERRIGLDVFLCVGPAALRVVDTHADVNSAAGTQNVIDLIAALQGSIGSRLIVAGDLNATPGDPGPQALISAGLTDVVAAHDASQTEGDRRIDYIFADGAVAPRVGAAQVIDTDKSDHRPVVAEIADLL